MPLTSYEDILNFVPLPLVMIGADARIVLANRSAEALFGPGMVRRHYITALRQPALLDCIEIVHSARAQDSQSVFLTNSAGRDVSYKVSVSTVAVTGQRMTLVVFEDITALQEAGQIRRDFVANVSHELRTPLTALLGFIETLKGAARDDAVARERFLGIMEREAGRMNRLVRDLLSLSRVESNERMRPTDPVEIAGLVRSTVQSLRPVAQEAGVALEITGDADLGDLRLPGDVDQLAQVLTNLIENAIKYGARGATVTVVLEEIAQEPILRGPAVSITVIDRGEGFDPIHIPRLTERFYRVDSHRSREMGGTGLGLAIVKHIVNRHRGRLRVATEPGKGSRFTVILPIS